MRGFVTCANLSWDLSTVKGKIPKAVKNPEILALSWAFIPLTIDNNRILCYG